MQDVVFSLEGNVSEEVLPSLRVDEHGKADDVQTDAQYSSSSCAPVDSEIQSPVESESAVLGSSPSVQALELRRM